MKKKFMLAAVAIFAAAAISLPSCGGSSPADAVVKMYEEATEQAKKATTQSEATAIEDQLYERIEKYCEEHGISKDYEPSANELKKLHDAEKNFYEAIDAID